jgi:uncharacterized protein (UPF0276 family)
MREDRWRQALRKEINVTTALSVNPIPQPTTGIGWRAPHYRELLRDRPPLGFLEVHSENFFASGGQTLDFLDQARRLYPISLHGVGLALGSADPLDDTHIKRLRDLIARTQPIFVSEHLCWGTIAGRHLNELLPLPYTEEALDHVCVRIDEVQERLGRTMMIENVSSYVRFTHSTIAEPEFIAQVCQRTGCDILLDVNNVYVSSVNHEFDPVAFIDALPAESCKEIHLAGYDVYEEDDTCLIDTHGRHVQSPVWDLFRHTVKRLGPRPTLIEWDVAIPDLQVLLSEAAMAAEILNNEQAVAA